MDRPIRLDRWAVERAPCRRQSVRRVTGIRNANKSTILYSAMVREVEMWSRVRIPGTVLPIGGPIIMKFIRQLGRTHRKLQYTK